MAAFMSASYISIPLMVVGTFKFGFPEVTAACFRAFAPRNRGLPRWHRGLMFANGVAFVFHHGSGMLFYACLLVGLARPPDVVALVPLAAQHLLSFVKYLNLDLTCFEPAPDDHDATESLWDISAVLKKGNGGAPRRGGGGDDSRRDLARRRRRRSTPLLVRAETHRSASRLIYTAILFLVEFWFQFEVYAFLPSVSLLPRASLFTLLASHYIWFAVGIGELFVTVDAPPKAGPRRQSSSVRAAMFPAVHQGPRSPTSSWGFPSDFDDFGPTLRSARSIDPAAADDDDAPLPSISEDARGP